MNGILKSLLTTDFKILNLNENASPVLNKKTYSISKRDFDNGDILENKLLLIFENNLCSKLLNLKILNLKKLY